MDANGLLRSMDLTIAFTESKMLNDPFIWQTSRKKKFLMPKDDTDLLQIISKVDIGPLFDNFDCTSLSASFLNKYSQTFNQIKIKSKSIYYKYMFRKKTMLRKNYFMKYKKSKLHYIIPKKCQHQVHPAQIQEGIRSILHMLLPAGIIGHQKNSKIILKAWKNLVKTAKTEPFSLLNSMEKLDLQSIEWMQSIDNKSHKIILISKFIKWLFEFLITTIEKVFHVTHIHGEKVFIFFEDWLKQKEDYIKLLSQRRVLQSIGSTAEYNGVQGRLLLIPKLRKLRPITIHRYEDVEIMKQIHTLLKYLYCNNYQGGNSLFNKNITDILKNYQSNKNETFLVACDITDAYGSIIQGKLFDIVQKLFQTLPEIVRIKCDTIRKVTKYQVITKDTNVLSYDPHKCKSLDRDHTLQVLKNHIYQTKVSYNKILYNINRGITQGFMISSILCRIYYSEMNAKYFADLEEHGHLFNYVDDYLYITNKLVSAERFLSIVEKGISEYNCHFERSKLKHNLDPHSSQSITYLGWKFDSQTLEVEPVYKPTRYIIYFNGLNARNFRFKLKKLASLKLHKLILAKDVNSEKNIFKNIALICRRQAERCFALASHLYDTQRQRVDMESIVKIHHYLQLIILKYTNWNSYERSKHGRAVKYMIWSSFYNAFQKRSNIFSYLTKEVKPMIRGYKRRRRT